jgi:hypothetical protein
MMDNDESKNFRPKPAPNINNINHLNCNHNKDNTNFHQLNIVNISKNTVQKSQNCTETINPQQSNKMKSGLLSTDIQYKTHVIEQKSFIRQSTESEQQIDNNINNSCSINNNNINTNNRSVPSITYKTKTMSKPTNTSKVDNIHMEDINMDNRYSSPNYDEVYEPSIDHEMQSTP